MITEIVGICTEMEQTRWSARDAAPQTQPQTQLPPLFPTGSDVPPPAADLQLPAVPPVVLVKSEFGSSGCGGGCSQPSLPGSEALFPATVDCLAPLPAPELQLDVADFIDSLLGPEAAQGAPRPGCEVKQEPLGLEDWLKTLAAAPPVTTGGDPGAYVITRPVIKTEHAHGGGAPLPLKGGGRGH